MTTNDRFAQAVATVGTALGDLPLSQLPPLVSFDVRVVGHHVHAEGRIEPMDRSAVGVLDAVLAWASELPEATLHAVEPPSEPGSWHLAARGVLGTVPVEVGCTTDAVPTEVTRVVRQAPNPWTAATSMVHAMVVDTAGGGRRKAAAN